MGEYFRRLGSFILDILQTVVMSIAIFMIIYLFLMRPHQVSGKSMVPNFQDGEYLLTEKVSYRLGIPERGDVIVFNAPPSRKQDYIKRIIALPGESIAIKERKIYVNDKMLDEKYLPKEFVTNHGEFLKEGIPYNLSTDEYIVFGDNRSNSRDSRDFGPIKKKDIIGKAWIVYWPLENTGAVPKASYSDL